MLESIIKITNMTGKNKCGGKDSRVLERHIQNWWQEQRQVVKRGASRQYLPPMGICQDALCREGRKTIC